MKITNVEIKNFKNIQNANIVLDSKSVIFAGNNAIGKTNTILAIYWCLTGSLLDNSQDNENLFRHFTTEPVTVTVKFNSGLVVSRQLLVGEENKITTNVIVNGKLYGLKKAESIIDNELGLGLIALKDNKAIKIRRLLLNPLYINYIGNKDLRDYFSNLLGLQLLPKRTFEKLPEIEQKALSPYLNDYYNVADMSKKIKEEKSKFEKERDFWKVVCEYLNEYQKLNTEDSIKAQTNRDTADSKVLAFVQTENALKDFINELTKAYNVSFKEITGLNVEFIRETKAGDGYELAFTPIIDFNGTELSNGSTSEQTNYCVRFVAAIRKAFNLPELPIFIDQTELFDDCNIKQVEAIANTQVITAKVVSCQDNEIHQVFVE